MERRQGTRERVQAAKLVGCSVVAVTWLGQEAGLAFCSGILPTNRRLAATKKIIVNLASSNKVIDS
jgi:hypothetical protein